MSKPQKPVFQKCYAKMHWWRCSPLLHSRGERGMKGRECNFQNKAHRNNSTHIHLGNMWCGHLQMWTRVSLAVCSTYSGPCPPVAECVRVPSWPTTSSFPVHQPAFVKCVQRRKTRLELAENQYNLPIYFQWFPQISWICQKTRVCNPRFIA